MILTEDRMHQAASEALEQGGRGADCVLRMAVNQSRPVETELLEMPQAPEGRAQRAEGERRRASA
jgi:hypothetical protein